jgi:hypothetical protein
VCWRLGKNWPVYLLLGMVLFELPGEYRLEGELLDSSIVALAKAQEMKSLVAVPAAGAWYGIERQPGERRLSDPGRSLSLGVAFSD